MAQIKKLTLNGKTIYPVTHPKAVIDPSSGRSIASAATQSADGLMSAADKKKLDGIAVGANNYSLPAATASVLGGVKLGSDTAQSVAANAVSDTASRTYAVQKNASGQLVVNVPWSDTNTWRPVYIGSEQVRSDSTSSGNLVLKAGNGINLSTTVDTSIRIDVSDTVAIGGGFSIAYDNEHYWKFSDNADLTSRCESILFEILSSFNVYATGGIGLNAGGNLYFNKTPTIGSDIRLKDAVKDVEFEEIQKATEIKLKSFTLKDDEKKKLHYGYIAQEVEQAIPDVVSKDAPTDDNPDPMRGLNYIELLALKTAYLEKKNADLETRIQNLESLVAKLTQPQTEV